MDWTGREKNVNTWLFGMFEGFGSGFNVFRNAPCETTHAAAFDGIGNCTHRFKVSGRGDSETGFDDIDTEFGKSESDFEFFAQIHTCPRRLLAVAESRVKYLNSTHENSVP
jgi:hypothetical protein